MTKRDFFILAIKLFGLYFVVATVFSAVPNDFAFALTSPDILALIWVILVLIIVVGLFVILIFKSERIVGLLKLDKGFDDDRIDLGSPKFLDVVKAAVFIIGGLLIIDNIPTFLCYAFIAFKKELSGIIYSGSSEFYWAVSTIKIILGFLLIKNYKSIATLLLKDHTEENE